MSGPCDCGAEDCPKCNPWCNYPKEDREPEAEDEETYKASDPENEYMDYICEGYKDAPY